MGNDQTQPPALAARVSETDDVVKPVTHKTETLSAGSLPRGLNRSWVGHLSSCGGRNSAVRPRLNREDSGHPELQGPSSPGLRVGGYDQFLQMRDVASPP